MDILANVLRLAGKPKIRKMKLNSGLLKIAACFVDYESEHLPPNSRIVEDSFVFSKLLKLPKGTALDVGVVARHNYISPSLAFMGWQVYGLDIRSEWQFHHPNFHFIQKDMRNSGLKDSMFDVVTCVSTIEHIGLAGYYGTENEEYNGDFKAFKEIKRVTKSGGTILLTVPYCKNYFARPGTRIYDNARLNLMSDGLLEKDCIVYWQDKRGDWFIKDRNIETEGVICLEFVKN